MSTTSLITHFIVCLQSILSDIFPVTNFIDHSCNSDVSYLFYSSFLQLTLSAKKYVRILFMSLLYPHETNVFGGILESACLSVGLCVRLSNRLCRK